MNDLHTSKTVGNPGGAAADNPKDASSYSTQEQTLVGPVPSYRELLPTLAGQETAGKRLLAVGMTLGDFELLRLLGAGGFGQVYLARQRSLGREVALKITANRGEEARTLARLEHDHIVQVFAEVVDEQRDLRLLCMQYIPGTTLERVIDELAKRPQTEWSGRLILEIIDAVSTAPAAFDPAALRDREVLGGSDFVEVVCWLGARLAEALWHAHRQGVLHRDVKPANVLMSRYGRPYLADFNVAAAAVRREGDGRPLFGGTLAYMAPEHMEAFLSGDLAKRESVDERADLYALGIVLYELFTGRLPFQHTLAQPGKSKMEALRVLIAERRGGPPPLPNVTGLPEVVARLVRRCLQADVTERYQTASELARALEGCRELRHVANELPPAGFLTRLLERWPFLVGCALIVLPHLLGSVVNVLYNESQIVWRLQPEQKSFFLWFVMIYNSLAYPICLLIAVAVIVPVRNVVLKLGRSEPLDASVVTAARQRALRLPLWTIVVSCLGWLPGGILFPLALHHWAGRIEGDVFSQFLISFTISGLIALTYSFLAMQYLVVRVLYPHLWIDAGDMRPTARVELRGLDRRLGLVQFLAVLIPLAGAVMMIGEGPDSFRKADYQTYRLVVTALIGMGMFGLGVAIAVTGRLRETLAVLTGSQRR
jgi:eukaryotic-like serine/threonine-protein kinase